jgi:ATP-dependent Clp protease ATP-binding subunit ClpA
MPQSVTFDLPLIVSGCGGFSLVRPIGFPEIALASVSEVGAVQAVKRRVVKACRDYLGADLVVRLVRGQVQRQFVVVEIAPAKKTNAWRDKVQVRLDSFVWQQDDALVVTYLPVLDLTVVASPQTDIDKLVAEQVRSAIRRNDDWTLPGLAKLDRIDQSVLRTETISVLLPTPVEHARKQDEKPRSKTPTLNAVATRLRGKSLRPAFHRGSDVQALGRLLASQGRSVLLVGPSGVGKTAVFHQWVREAELFGMKDVPCWATDGSRLISGQTGFGMWQQQCLAMAEEAARYRSIIHLGNLVQLSESGRLRGSGGCGALLAPRLADGSMSAVIECTPEQLTRVARVEPRLVAALTILRIEEPTPEQTRSILLEAAASWRPIDITAELTRQRRRKRKGRGKRLGSSSQAANHLCPEVKPEALQVLDRLHRRFRTDAAAPGRPLAFFQAVMSELQPDETLDVPKVIAAFGRQTGLPRFLIDDAVRPDLKSIGRELRSQVLGQDAVLETLVDLIATLAADLSRGDRPLASLMLIGPTGVGKTETAKALARLIYSDVSRLVRIDMSELSSPLAVGRLIGDAVHPEGMLTSAVRAQPFSLVLLDEFEKAHPAVFDLLLQVLGEGRLTDGRGRLADFRNSIVLMTSNLGVDTFRAVPLGLADTQQQQRYRNHFERQVRDFLRPELFNRIDRILTFDPLTEATVRRIADLRLGELQRRDGWQSRGDEFQVDRQAVQLLTERGYQPQYGARPLAREVERSIVVPLAEAICDSGRLKRLSAEVSVAADHAQQLTVTVRADPEQAKPHEDSLGRLIGQATLLRRRGQALDRSDLMRRLRNDYTLASRKLKAKLRGTKDVQKRARIRYGSLGAACAQLRERIRAIRRLCHDLDQAEARILLKHYRGARFDLESAGDQLDALQQRLWTTLCELRSESSIENQRLTLVITGPQLSAAYLLLAAYRTLAVKRQWNFQAHALLPRDHNNSRDRVIDCEGWSRDPSFRVSTVKVAEDVETAILGLLDEADKPKLAAYRLLRLANLTSLPAGTIGLMLTFRGEAAALMMGGEAGVHTFSRLNQSKSTGSSVLVSKHKGPPIEYAAPDWLPRRQFQVSGHPRRWYDEEAGRVQDLVEDDAREMKMDREGVWLETLIEQEMERRIWAELDEF